MNKNNDKIWDIANDDLVIIAIFLEKIKAIAASACSCLSDLLCESTEKAKNALYMVDVIEDLTNMADKSLSESIEKLCAIYRETKEMEAAK